MIIFRAEKDPVVQTAWQILLVYVRSESALVRCLFLSYVNLCSDLLL